MTKTNQPQRGSTHVLVVVILVLVLITALGWIFWQNFIHKESTQTDTRVTVADKSDGAKVTESKELSLPQDVIFKRNDAGQLVASPHESGRTTAVLKSASDVDTKLKDVTSSLKTFLESELANNQQNECEFTIYIDRVYKQKYASGSVGCLGGHAALWADVNGGWKEIIGAQEAPSCTVIKKVMDDYGVPLEDLEALKWDICYSGSNGVASGYRSLNN